LVDHDGVVPFLLNLEPIEKSSHPFRVKLQFFVVVFFIDFKVVDKSGIEVLQVIGE
jgi:hypothetical protein